MIIATLKETTPGEQRVAATPETVKKYTDLGFKVRVETNAGLAAGFDDESYLAAGAEIAKTPEQTVKSANIIIKIHAPLVSEDRLFSQGQTIIANFDALSQKERIKTIAALGVDAFALELLPRISRAQSMDILSSQSNLAGYKAVIEAFNLLPKAAPLLMTAAGTNAPARVLVLGAGVAGLQAIATAKRLGAVVYASDVRIAAKEQVESLGAKFVDVAADEDMETNGGYAKEASKDYLKRQKEAVAERLKQTDIAITTALIPGKPAPKLIDAKMLKQMPKGSVVVDMAANSGGNVEGSKKDSLIDIDGIRVLGNSNLASSIPYSASLLFAKNIFNFLSAQYDKEKKELKFNFDDDLVSQTCICRNGQYLLEDRK